MAHSWREALFCTMCIPSLTLIMPCPVQPEGFLQSDIMRWETSRPLCYLRFASGPLKCSSSTSTAAGVLALLPWEWGYRSPSVP